MTRVSEQDELSALLGALIEEKGIRKIVRWDTAALSSLDPALTGAGAKVISINLNDDEASRPDLRNALIRADMGLTEVDYAVADIGSLVLRASGPQSRLAPYCRPSTLPSSLPIESSLPWHISCPCSTLRKTPVRRVPGHGPFPHRRHRDHPHRRDPRPYRTPRRHPGRGVTATAFSKSDFI